jgi:hypothetical protein
MRGFNSTLIMLMFYIFILSFTGCSTNFKDMPEDEFWNEIEGRIKGKTDSTYYYQIEMFDTKAEYKNIDVLDNPIITSNFTKIVKINSDASADTSLFYTIRITQKKRGFERITKPITEQLDLVVNNKHVVELNIQRIDVQYVLPLYSAEYGYKNGYYYCDVMCPIEYGAFVFLANAIKIEGKLNVNTTIIQDNKSIDGEITFRSYERPGDAQIVNRFYNSNPTK